MVSMEENMIRIYNLLKKTLNFPIMWLSGLYLYWFLSVPMDESFITGLTLLGIYFAITVLDTFAKANKIPFTALLIILLPFSWVASSLTIWLLTGWLDREFIFSVLMILFASYPAFNILQKPSSKIKTLSILLFIETLPFLAVNLIYFVSYIPQVIDETEFGDFNYYIVSGMDMDYHSHLSFAKCKKSSPKCIILYRRYDRQDFEEIIVDKEKNEVSAIGSGPNLRLVYTDGEHPRLYEGYPTQLGNYIYQMSTDYDSCGSPTCDVYVYTLYECNLNYMSCDPLPIQYTQEYEIVIVLEADTITHEISAYDYYDDLLIFTYGENSRCHADDCVILEDK